MKQRLDPKKLDQLKEINLINFATASYGYVVDKKESSKSWAVLRNEADDKLLIKKHDTGHWSFTNLRNENERGTITDLVKKEEPHLTFIQRVQKITNYKPSVQTGMDVSESSKNTFNKNYLKDVFKLNENSSAYMVNERKIDKEILLNDPKFKDKVLVHKTDKYLNTVFPISNKEKSISGFIVKNTGFSGYMETSEHKDSLWISNYDKNKKIEKIFMAENPIDAISHYQLNKKELQNKNVVYMSSGGSPTKEHHQLIDTFIKQRSHDEKNGFVETINDNDLRGRAFSIKLTAELQAIKKEDAPLISHVGYATKKDHSDIQANISFKKATPEQISSFTNSFDKKQFEVSAAERNDETKVVSVKFPKESKEHWDNLQKNLNQFNKNEVKSTYSKAKDFNQELKNTVKESSNSISRKF